MSAAGPPGPAGVPEWLHIAHVLCCLVDDPTQLRERTHAVAYLLQHDGCVSGLDFTKRGHVHSRILEAAAWYAFHAWILPPGRARAPPDLPGPGSSQAPGRVVSRVHYSELRRRIRDMSYSMGGFDVVRAASGAYGDSAAPERTEPDPAVLAEMVGYMAAAFPDGALRHAGSMLDALFLARRGAENGSPHRGEIMAESGRAASGIADALPGIIREAFTYGPLPADTPLLPGAGGPGSGAGVGPAAARCRAHMGAGTLRSYEAVLDMCGQDGIDAGGA